MPNLYGFRNWAQQRGSPLPSDVGRMLMMRGMQEGPGPDAMPMHEGAESAAMETAEGGMDRLTQEPDPHTLAQGSAWPSATESALRAAILRATGTEGIPRTPGPLNREQLLRLGLRQEDVDLMHGTGGVNVE